MPSAAPESERVVAVDAAQHPVGQAEAVNLPAPLPRRVRGVVEILVRRLKKAEVESVHLLLGDEVRAEENAVAVVDEELARRVGLAAEFGGARADVHVKVRVLFEPARDLREALGALGDVRADETRARVAREDAVALLQQLGLREVRAVERPVGVRAQLLVALVEAVYGLEEGVRVGGVE